jgi:hypothetical protein
LTDVGRGLVPRIGPGATLANPTRTLTSRAFPRRSAPRAAPNLTTPAAQNEQSIAWAALEDAARKARRYLERRTLVGVIVSGLLGMGAALILVNDLREDLAARACRETLTLRLAHAEPVARDVTLLDGPLGAAQEVVGPSPARADVVVIPDGAGFLVEGKVVLLADRCRRNGGAP